MVKNSNTTKKITFSKIKLPSPFVFLPKRQILFNRLLSVFTKILYPFLKTQIFYRSLYTFVFFHLTYLEMGTDTFYMFKLFSWVLAVKLYTVATGECRITKIISRYRGQF